MWVIVQLIRILDQYLHKDFAHRGRGVKDDKRVRVYFFRQEELYMGSPPSSTIYLCPSKITSISLLGLNRAVQVIYQPAGRPAIVIDEFKKMEGSFFFVLLETN